MSRSTYHAGVTTGREEKSRERMRQNVCDRDELRKQALHLTDTTHPQVRLDKIAWVRMGFSSSIYLINGHVYFSKSCFADDDQSNGTMQQLSAYRRGGNVIIGVFPRGWVGFTW